MKVVYEQWNNWFIINLFLINFEKTGFYNFKVKNGWDKWQITIWK
jgi:hypothetical protein